MDGMEKEMTATMRNRPGIARIHPDGGWAGVDHAMDAMVLAECDEGG